MERVISIRDIRRWGRNSYGDVGRFSSERGIQEYRRRPSTEGSVAMIPQGGAWRLRREANLSLGARDSSTTGHCVVPARGLYNPLGTEYTIQDWAGREDGGGNYSGHRYLPRCRGLAIPKNPSYIPAPFAQPGIGRGWISRAR